jgi:hypothetical protein
VSALQASCVIDHNFDARITYRRAHSGIYFGSYQSMVNHSDLEEQKRQIQAGLNLNNFSIDSFQYDISLDPEPVVSESASLTVSWLLSPEGEYLTLWPEFLTDEIKMPARSRNRRTPVYLKRGYIKRDSVNFIIPDNLSIQSIPEPVVIDNEFGRYEYRITAKGNQIRFYREFILREGQHDASSFNVFYRFLRKASATDQRTVLLTRI